MKRLTILFFLPALSCAFAADTPLENFVGLTIGQSHKEIAGKISKRENLVGPGKGIFDDAGKSRNRGYVIQVRCPDVPRQENISIDQADRETSGSAGGGPSKSPATDYLKRAL